MRAEHEEAELVVSKPRRWCPWCPGERGRFDGWRSRIIGISVSALSARERSPMEPLPVPPPVRDRGRAPVRPSYRLARYGACFPAPDRALHRAKHEGGLRTDGRAGVIAQSGRRARPGRKTGAGGLDRTDDTRFGESIGVRQTPISSWWSVISERLGLQSQSPGVPADLLATGNAET